MSSHSGERKFSYEDFCVEDDDGRLEIVVGELQAYVAGRISSHVEKAMADVVRKLNDMGHRLQLEDDGVGGLGFVDVSRGKEEKRLRLAIDFTVSAGFEVPHSNPEGGGEK